MRHCTFINSYIAVKFSTTNGGGCPNVFDIYGTALHEGVVMDHIADVGRIDGVLRDRHSSLHPNCKATRLPLPSTTRQALRC
ncbi:MAG: hypothetical protein IJV45_01410 [Prevotella sp.]|nr:hypothetical protein [Prevotella sp.]